MSSRLNRLMPYPAVGPLSARIQDATQDALDSGERSSLGPASRNGAAQASNGNQTESRSIPENTPTLIAHKLGRKYRGWNVALKNAGQSFYCPRGEVYDRSKFICVQWGDGTVSGDPPIDAEFWVY